MLTVCGAESLELVIVGRLDGCDYYLMFAVLGVGR